MGSFYFDKPTAIICLISIYYTCRSYKNNKIEWSLEKARLYVSIIYEFDVLIEVFNLKINKN